MSPIRYSVYASKMSKVIQNNRNSGSTTSEIEAVNLLGASIMT